MNQNPETKNQTKYKPLLYIIANDKSSLQQVVSSAITTATLADENNQSSTNSTLEILKTSGLIALELVLPFSFRTTEKIIELLNRQIKQNKNVDQVQQNEERKSEDIDKILHSLNLEDWSAFITQISYSSIPEDLDFPPGHPLPNKLYRSHPLKSNELTNDNSYSISGKIGLAEGLLQNVAGLDAGASFNRYQTQVNLISVEFAPPIND